MPVLSEEIRNRIRAEFPKYPDKRAVTLNALHMVHDAYREVSTEAIREIAELLELHPSEVLDTMSFYNFFHEADNPLGKKRVWVCRSISCMLRGGEALLAHTEQRLGIKVGESTSDGRIFLKQEEECLAACTGAPMMMVDHVYHENLTAERVDRILDELK